MSSLSNVEEESSLYRGIIGEEEDDKLSCLAVTLTTEDAVKYGVFKAVLDLNILDMINKCGPGAFLSAAEIVTKLPTTNPTTATAALGRMLDFLASHSILLVTPITLPDHRIEKRYGLAPICKFFIPDEHGFSFAPFMDRTLVRLLHSSSLCFKDAVLESVEPFTKAQGCPMNEYIGKHPEFQPVFHNAMSNHSGLVLRKILKVYKGFEGLSSLVDVGGSNGTALGLIVSQYPAIKGINFDQPHIIAKASSYPGVEHVGGDMFAEIPKGEAIFLKGLAASTQLLRWIWS